MREALKLEGELFALALARLTRLRVGARGPVSDDLEVRAVKYHPAVGLVVGGIGALVFWAAALVLPLAAALVLSLVATVLATGAYHERGLVLAAEALLAGDGRDRALAVLDRGRAGTAGALALGLVLALKLVLLGGLPVWPAGVVLIVAHVVGRMAAVHINATSVSARSAGMQLYMPGVTPDGYRVALATTLAALLLAVLVVGPGAAFCGMIGAIALGQVLRIAVLRVIGGYTGACLGGAQQLGELGFVLGVLVWL